MRAVPKPRLTVAAYLSLERNAAYRSEFYKGEMFAMAGASYAHNRIKENLVVELGSQLKEGPCRTLSSDQRVHVQETDLLTYPDIIILCGPPTFDPLDQDTLINPTAILEVLSPSTERFDRGEKFRNYQQIPSLKEIVLVAQDAPVCERFIRLPDNSWGLVSFVGFDSTLEFTSVPVRIPLTDVFAEVSFPESIPR